MKYIELEDINEYKSESINPAKMQETVFELYSVPVYETGHPEYLTGKQIASSKIVVKKMIYCYVKLIHVLIVFGL